MIERLRRCPGPAGFAADQDDIGLALGDAGGHGADADLGDQLDVDAGARVGVLQVVNQLGQVLDRVDVVVRRRRNQPDVGGGMPGLGDPGIDLETGQLAALARLGALGHLDLQVRGVGQVVAGDAEAAGGHLLDGAVAPVPVGIGLDSGPGPRRLRRCCSCRRCGSWRSPVFRGLPC